MSLKPIDGVDLKGKLVQLRADFFKPGMKPEDHRFRCEGGFGCNPAAMGTKVFGTFVSDGEQCFVRRQSIEGIVEE